MCDLRDPKKRGAFRVKATCVVAERFSLAIPDGAMEFRGVCARPLFPLPSRFPKTPPAAFQRRKVGCMKLACEHPFGAPQDEAGNFWSDGWFLELSNSRRAMVGGLSV